MYIYFNFHQSAVIPYRFLNGDLEICLITSVKKKKWIIPKGYIDFNLSPFESAKKEAFEEAGILGNDNTYDLGIYKVKKQVGIVDVRVFSLEVTKTLDDFPEVKMRQRRWFKFEEANNFISNKEIVLMLQSLKEKLSTQN